MKITIKQRSHNSPASEENIAPVKLLSRDTEAIKESSTQKNTASKIPSSSGLLDR
jgi:hypothetical protein